MTSSIWRLDRSSAARLTPHPDLAQSSGHPSFARLAPRRDLEQSYARA
ncbi:hypothetical protein ONA91_22005 [Micromonospora sp. DR5-3]|nr:MULTISPECIES: hypothetical protein [unclassified Micromonospora]MCW3817128.1 hypothetical protein [Micromonospora sp. DR5-3]